MYKVLTILMVAVLLSACGKQGIPTSELQPGDVCYGISTESRICELTRNDPRALDSALLAVNFGAVKAEAYDAVVAVEVVDRIINFIDENGNLVWTDLIGYALKEVEDAQAILLIAGPYIDQLNRKVPVSAADLKLVKIHLVKQRTLLQMLVD